MQLSDMLIKILEGIAVVFGLLFTFLYLNDVLTVPASLAGLPAISVPSGFNSEKLPIGLQLIGKPFDEISVLAAGAVIEESRGF